MTLQDWADECHRVASSKGFWDDEVDPNFVLAKLALIASEVSEVLEAYRKGQGAVAVATEMADIFVRLADLYGGMQEHGIINPNDTFDNIVRSKVEVNKTREAKHGNLI